MQTERKQKFKSTRLKLVVKTCDPQCGQEVAQVAAEIDRTPVTRREVSWCDKTTSSIY